MGSAAEYEESHRQGLRYLAAYGASGAYESQAGASSPPIRALPDAELDDFVDAIAARLASFDRTSLASAKTMVNRASLPPDADLVTAYGEFAHSMTLPGYLSRVASAEALVPQLGLDFELRMGEYIGIANQLD